MNHVALLIRPTGAPAANLSLRPLVILLVALLAMIARVARADLDADGDGLSDIDETTIHHTDPNNADTDGDGVIDGFEIQMGTNPLDRHSVLRMLPPSRQPGGAWRVCWVGQPGQSYRIECANPAAPARGGGLTWVPLTTVTANAQTNCFDDRSGITCLYRVALIVNTNNDVLPPIVSLITASPPPLPPQIGSSMLSVIARDLAGVVRVEFLDGNTILGSATRGANNTWAFNWPLNLNLNGRHYLRARAYDAAGNAGYSPALAFDVNLSPNQRCVTVGRVTICADNVLANPAGGSTYSGRVRIGGINLAAGGSVTVNGSIITGSGSVVVPGLSNVFSGSFMIDAGSGILSGSGSARAIGFNSRISVTANSISVDVATGSICAGGSVTVQVPGHGFGPATFTGTICSQPMAGTLTASGALQMGSFAGNGTATLQLHDSTFVLMGDARFRSAHGVYTVSNAVARLAYARAVPNVAVSGQLAMPQGLRLAVEGNISATGEANLYGEGAGRIRDYEFSSIKGTLYHPPGLTTNFAATFEGRLADPNFSQCLVTGTLLGTGHLDASNTCSRATISNFVFSPFNLHVFGNVFSNSFTIEFGGRLWLQYLRPITFAGVLRPDGSMSLDGGSGPYTMAQFAGAVPDMNTAGLTFEDQFLIGCHHLQGRNPSVAVGFSFAFTRAARSAGGVCTLSVTASNTSPVNPTLTLTGTASTSGACSLSTGARVTDCSVWGFNVGRLGCTFARSATGKLSFTIHGAVLNYGPFGCQSAQGAGSIQSDGSGGMSFSFGPCALNGYPIQTTSLTMTQSVSGARWLKVNSCLLVVPGSSGLVKADLTGEMYGDGNYTLSGQTTADLTFNGQPVDLIRAGASATLTPGSLSVRGDAVVSAWNFLSIRGSISATATIPAQGPPTVRLSGNVLVAPPQFGEFKLVSTDPISRDGSFEASFGPNGLRFPPGARLLYKGQPLNPALPLLEFTIDVTGSTRFDVIADMTAGARLNNFKLSNLRFTFRVSARIAVCENMKAKLEVPGATLGVSRELYGSIDQYGNLALDYHGSISFAGGFSTQGDGHIALRNSGLTASGSMVIAVNGNPLGTNWVSVTVDTNGHYCTTVSAQLILGTFQTFPFNLRVCDTGLSGTPDLFHGNFANGRGYRVRLENLVLTPFSIGASGSYRFDSGWKTIWDSPVPAPGDGHTGDWTARVVGKVSINLGGNGEVRASFVEAESTFAWWIVKWECGNCRWEPQGYYVGSVWVELPPIWKCDCRNTTGPEDINSSLLNGQRATVRANIEVDGSFKVNYFLPRPEHTESLWPFNLW